MVATNVMKPPNVQYLVILGSTGLIGSKILMEFQKNGYEILTPNRDQIQNPNSIYAELSNKNVVVVNALANGNLENMDESKYVNYDLPRNQYELIFNRVDKLKWIQLSSYFSEYMRVYGKHKNSYAMYKDHFSNFLQSQSNIDKVNVIDYELPHIYSSQERANRMMSTLARNLLENKPITLSDCEQIIPVLKLDSAIDMVSKDLLHDLQNIRVGYTRIQVPAQLVCKLRYIVEEFIEVFGTNKAHLIGMDSKFNRNNEFYELIWPLVEDRLQLKPKDIALDYFTDFALKGA